MSSRDPQITLTQIKRLKRILDSPVSDKLYDDWCGWAKERWDKTRNKSKLTVREFIADYYTANPDGLMRCDLMPSIFLAAGLDTENGTRSAQKYCKWEDEYDALMDYPIDTFRFGDDETPLYQPEALLTMCDWLDV
jgi:hypothetical protein